MKTISAILCLVILAGCGTFSKQESGIFQPNKLDKVNSHVSKMIPRSEQVKLSNGIPIPPRTNSVKSVSIPAPHEPVSPAPTASNMNVPRGLTIIPSQKMPAEEAPEPTESFTHRLVRYSVLWACFLGFAYLIYLSFKKYKLPKDNPFKKEKPASPKPEQLTLKL